MKRKSKKIDASEENAQEDTYSGEKIPSKRKRKNLKIDINELFLRQKDNQFHVH